MDHLHHTCFIHVPDVLCRKSVFVQDRKQVVKNILTFVSLKFIEPVGGS